ALLAGRELAYHLTLLALMALPWTCVQLRAERRQAFGDDTDVLLKRLEQHLRVATVVRQAVAHAANFRAQAVAHATHLRAQAVAHAAHLRAQAVAHATHLRAQAVAHATHLRAQAVAHAAHLRAQAVAHAAHLRAQAVAHAAHLRAQAVAHAAHLRAQAVAHAAHLRAQAVAHAAHLRAQVVAHAANLRAHLRAQAVDLLAHLRAQAADLLPHLAKLHAHAANFRVQAPELHVHAAKIRAHLAKLRPHAANFRVQAPELHVHATKIGAHFAKLRPHAAEPGLHRRVEGVDALGQPLDCRCGLDVHRAGGILPSSFQRIVGTPADRIVALRAIDPSTVDRQCCSIPFGKRSATRFSLMLCSSSAFTPARTSENPCVELVTWVTSESPSPVKPDSVMRTKVVPSGCSSNSHSTVVRPP